MSDPGAALNLRIEIPAGYQLVFDKKRLKALLRSAGVEVAALARALIRRSEGGGRLYRGSGGARYRGGYRAGHYTASAPGKPPVSVTGNLARQIRVRPFRSGEGVAIRDLAFYALFLQQGARGGGRRKSGGAPVPGKGGIGKSRVLLPRPFLTAALDQRRDSLAARIKASIVDDVEFRRLKA